MLDTIKSRIRGAAWAWLGPQQASPQPETINLPLGIDRNANLPIYYEPPECPLCITPEGRCHDCGGSLSDPEAPFGYGVESATITHIHIHSIPDSGGKQIRVSVRRKLCIPCFRLDWAKAKPGVICDL